MFVAIFEDVIIVYNYLERTGQLEPYRRKIKESRWIKPQGWKNVT